MKKADKEVIIETVYKRLAQFLNNLPGGYPATESGVELRILQRLFDQNEAEIVMALSPMPESPSVIAERLHLDEATLADKLNEMSRKGLINRYSKNDVNLYMAANFIVGIWEFQVNRLTKELISDFDEYIPDLLKSMDNVKTKQMRVIPISKSIPMELNVMPYDEAGKLIKSQAKIVVIPCICRTERKMAGEGCSAPMESCLAFGISAYYYEGNGIGRTITQEEALELLDKAIDAGLVLQPTNSQKALALCMCCSCCCGILRNIKKYDSPAKFVTSNFYATTVKENCNGCGNCADICPMKAVAVNEVAQVNTERCIGCGLCVTRCDPAAVKLMKKSNETIPPATIFETFMKISQERGLM